jgi:hypothetical protein
MSSSSYKCLYCVRIFATPYGLKRHISERHQYNNDDDEEESFQTNIIVEEPGLWDDYDVQTLEESGLWDEDFIYYAEVTIIYHRLLSKNN